MSRGFITLGIDTEKDRIRYCYGLALSLKLSDPTAEVCVVVDQGKADDVPEEYHHAFDYIIELPFGNTAYKDGFHGMNLWQLYHCTPFEETIYLDADTLVHRVIIDDLWDAMSTNDLSINEVANTYRNLPTTQSEFEFENAYNLPKLYNNIIYWKQESRAAEEWFKMIDPILQNWRSVYNTFFEDKKPETFNKNILCNIATHCLDCYDDIRVRVHNHYEIRMNTQGIWGEGFPDDWTESLNFWISDQGKIQIENSVISSGIIHYTDENFLTDHCINVFRTNLTKELERG